MLHVIVAKAAEPGVHVPLSLSMAFEPDPLCHQHISHNIIIYIQLCNLQRSLYLTKIEEKQN